MIKSFEQFNKVCESTQINEITDKFKQTFGKQLRDIKIAASRKEKFSSKVITCPEWSEPDTDMSFRITFEWLPDFEVYYCNIYRMKHDKVVNTEIRNFNTHGFGGSGTEQGYVGNAKALVRILADILKSWWYPYVMSDDELERLSNREHESNDSWYYSEEEF